MQAPQSPAPQPNFVPVSFSSSRMTQSSGVSSGASETTGFAFTVKRVGMAVLLTPARRPIRAPLQMTFVRMRRSRGIGNRPGSEIRFRRGRNRFDGDAEIARIVLGADIFQHRTLLDAPVALHRAPRRGEGARVLDMGDGFDRLAVFDEAVALDDVELSVCGVRNWSTKVLVFNPIVSTTSVSPFS